MKNSNLNLLGLLKDGSFQFGRLTGPDLEAYARTFSALAALEVSKATAERRAAPELLAALQACLGPLQDEYNRAGHTGHQTEAARAFVNAKAAIAKATGQDGEANFEASRRHDLSLA